ncbi:restriction endonuclease [Luteimonas sp. SDU82]|uniref:restriction endonuclease n=1 Tax=Luteimonas sp. SDU82 TaxID=3422592 RepID=UPI003EB8DA12
MPNWLIAIGVALLIGSIATFHFRTVQLRRDETRAGIRALSGVSWRSFIHMVLDALSRRGYRRVVDAENPAGDSDYILERDGDHWLLSCKHGSAFLLGRLTVNELSRAIELKGAVGGFLVTQGRITDDARPVASLQRIELLDGPALWPQLRDFLPADQLAGIRAGAARAARQRVLLSWLLALLAGVAVWLALPPPAPVARPAAAPAVAADVARPGEQPAAATAPAVDPGLPSVSLPGPQAPAATTPDIEQQRADIAAAVSTLPDVDRAAWSSESTLQVFLSAIQDDPFGRICPLVERYDDLAASRIQLTPPPGSDATVRFRQCRSY